LLLWAALSTEDPKEKEGAVSFACALLLTLRGDVIP
jgi:hypothetical protein